ncbi:MAG: hypothetical protein ACXVPU_02410 [Bacteroidia bacterium]
MKLSNRLSLQLLILLLLTFSVLMYEDTITLFPAFIHSWTQSDRYALALGFLHNGFDFFHPATFNLQTINGITRVDFPINEYFVAIFMKLSGTTSPAVFRAYTLVVSLIGLIFLFLMTKKITSSELKAWIVTFFVFLSPVYVYYQDGFIPSIPAIAYIFIGYYYFFSYKEDNRKINFFISIFFMLLAALMRMPFLIFLLAIIFQELFIGIKNKQFKIAEAFTFIISLSIFIAYYLYNVHLGRIYGNMFLNTIMPAKSFSEFKEILAEMLHHWGKHYFTLWHYFLLLMIIVVGLVNYFKRGSFLEENKKYWFHLLIIFCGATLYFLLMARQYYAHDYYFLDSFFVPVIFLLIFSIKSVRIESVPQKAFWSSVFIGAGILFFIFSQKVQAERYSTGPWDRTEITRQNFIGTEAYLDKAGIPKDAKILVIDAYTTNAPLILMNRKGYTVLGTTKKNIGTSLFFSKWDYVAIQDNYLVSDVIKNYPLLTMFLQRVGGTGKVSFYKRSERTERKSLKQFLGITPESTFYKTLITFDSINRDTLHITGVIHISKIKNHGSAFLLQDSTLEYGTTIGVKASELKNEKNLKMLVSADLLADKNFDKIQLVAAVTNRDKTVFYQSFVLSDYFKQSDNWQKMEFQFVLPTFETPEDLVKVYLWNPEKKDLSYDNFEVIIYK